MAEISPLGLPTFGTFHNPFGSVLLRREGESLCKKLQAPLAPSIYILLGIQDRVHLKNHAWAEGLG